MDNEPWKGYAIVLTIAVFIGILFWMNDNYDLHRQIDAMGEQRKDADEALEEARTSLLTLKLTVQGKDIDLDKIDPKDEKAMDRAAEIIIADPDPDDRFDEIEEAMKELSQILNRHKEP